MKRLYALLSILFFVVAPSLAGTGDSIRVSLLTAAPGTAVYELFGHTGIRLVFDEVSPRTGDTLRCDLVFNYGLFDFEAPHFLYRFTKGETDYSIGASTYDAFVRSYTLRGSAVYELPLNLRAGEARRLLEALRTNMQPQNRVYRYNFLYDNCATRPRDKIEEALDCGIVYDKSDTTAATFRRLIHECTARHAWLTFGIDLALGAPLDRPTTYREQMFLPAVLADDLAHAYTTDENGEERFIGAPVVTHEAQVGRAEYAPTPFTPVIVFWAALGIVMLVSAIEYRKGRHLRALDYVIFGLYGLFGCVLFFLIFISIHPATSPNYSALWCHPLWWFAALCEAFVPHRRITAQAMSLLLLATAAFFIAAPFVPQVFNPAFYPAAAIPAVRCIAWITTERKCRRL